MPSTTVIAVITAPYHGDLAWSSSQAKEERAAAIGNRSRRPSILKVHSNHIWEAPNDRSTAFPTNGQTSTNGPHGRCRDLSGSFLRLLLVAQPGRSHACVSGATCDSWVAVATWLTAPAPQETPSGKTASSEPANQPARLRQNRLETERHGGGTPPRIGATESRGIPARHPSQALRPVAGVPSK